ncbi:MAG: 50S ribosomal protein L25 [Candidatus Brocadiaceae bacterium]|nr:50S ribosomal protein L25 [Candidatus Brocadiaceae bacterium]
MDIAQLQAQPRDASGLRGCRRLRKQGLVPAVVYGRGEPNAMLSVRRGDVEKLLAEHSLIVQVLWDGHEENTQVREIQFDALGDHILHVDLQRISLTEVIVVRVPIEVHGEAAGVKAGGVLDVQLHEVEVECMPTAVPEKLRAEVAALEIGDDIRVSDLKLPDGVKVIDDADAVVVAVAPPADLEEKEAEGLGEETSAEPEVIGRAAAEGAGDEE